MIINNSFEDPYNKFAPEGNIPIISKSIVKSKLSNKFNQIMELASNYYDNENQKFLQTGTKSPDNNKYEGTAGKGNQNSN